MVMLGQFLHIWQNFEIFHDKLEPGLRDDISSLTLEGFQLSASD